jgi:hypothetical protein
MPHPIRSAFLALSLASFAVFSSPPAEAQLRVRNAVELRKSYGLTSYPKRVDRLSRLKIAVLDNSFEGVHGESRKLARIGRAYSRPPTQPTHRRQHCSLGAWFSDGANRVGHDRQPPRRT